MRTPSPNPESSRSSAAAALLELSQTPPQRTASAHKSPEMSNPLGRHAIASPFPWFCSPHATQCSTGVQEEPIANDTPPKPTDEAAHSEHRLPQTSANALSQRATLDTPQRLSAHVYVFPSPTSDSAGVCKVSNSDDEDVDLHARGYHHGKSEDHIEVPQMPHAALPGLKTTVVNKSPSIAVESGYEMHYMGIAGPPSAQQLDQPASLSEQRPQTIQRTLTIGPDELESYLRHIAPSSQSEHGALRPASIPPQHSQQTISRLTPSNEMMAGPRNISQPSVHVQNTLAATNFDARLSQQAFQTTPATKQPDTRSGLYGVFIPSQSFTDCVETWKQVQAHAVPPQTVLRPVEVHPESQAANAPRDGFGPKPFDVRDLTYRTIKSIKMPARNDSTPGQSPPEPTPFDQPYGYDIDYRASMLIWWCDDLELSYSETMRRYRLRFPDERTITEDTVRKRHIFYIEKLARRYGLKPQEELEEPRAWVARRGKQTGHKYNTINGVSVYSASAGQDAGNIRRRRIRAEPTQHRGFLKACICVWKDTSNVSFEQIKQRLQDEHSWNIGANTVQKLYYSERARVYDTHKAIADTNEGPALINTPDEDLRQLKAHFQQRNTYLLRFGQHVTAQDVSYMQELQRLTHNMEQNRLQRAQLMGHGPIEMDHCTANEGVGADVMMHDAVHADPGNAGTRDVN